MSVYLPHPESPLDGLAPDVVVSEKIVRELRAENAELRRVLRALAHRAMANLDALDVPEAPESFRCWAGSHKPGRVQVRR